MVVEYYVGDSTHTPMAGDRYHGQWQLVGQVCINRNQPLGAAADQHAWILLNQIGSVAVVSDKVEIIFFEQAVADSGHHFGVIAVGQHRNQDADCHGAAISQRSRKETGLIVEFECRLADSLPCSFGNGTSGHIIQDD